MSTCTIELHEEIKKNPRRWLLETTLIGFQRVNKHKVLEMRNCKLCGSTLCSSREGDGYE